MSTQGDDAAQAPVLPDPFSPEVTRALREAGASIEKFFADLVTTYPALASSMALPGMLIGHGLGVLVASGMSNDQIVDHVLGIVGQIRTLIAATPARA